MPRGHTFGIMKTITVSNLAGGPGKSVSSVYFAFASAEIGLKTCLIDADPQGSQNDLFKASGKTSDEIAETKNLLLAITKPKSKNIVGISDNFDLMPGHVSMTALDNMYEGKESLDMIPKVIKTLKGYDVVIIDCPSYGGTITSSALYAADIVVIPTDATVKAVENAHNVLHNIQFFNEKGGRSIKPFILPTKIDSLPFQYTHKYFKEVISTLPAPVLSPIPFSNEVRKQFNEKNLKQSGKVYTIYKRIFEELWHL